MNNIIDLIGRIFISGVFLLSGFNKIGNYEGTVRLDGIFWSTWIFINSSNYLRDRGPILIISRLSNKNSAGALSLFCLATAINFHTDFCTQMQLVAFMNKTALAGEQIFLSVIGAKGYFLIKNNLDKYESIIEDMKILK